MLRSKLSSVRLTKPHSLASALRKKKPIDFEFNGDAGMTFVRTVLIHAPSGEQRTSRHTCQFQRPKTHRRWAAALHMPSGTACNQPLAYHQKMMMAMKQAKHQKVKYNTSTQTMKGHGNGLR